MPVLVYDNLPFPASDLDDDNQNRALGRFFTAWGQVEVTYGFIFRELCGLSASVATTMFEKIRVRDQLDILDDIVEMIADDSFRQVLADTLAAVRNLSVARNKLAHSRWGFIDNESARFWVGMTAEQAQAIAFGDQKGAALRERFIFTVAEIDTLTNACLTQRDALIRAQATLLEMSVQRQGQDGAHLLDRLGHRHPALRE